VAAPTDAEAERRLKEARDLVARGTQALAEGHRQLRALAGQVAHARLRGQINHEIWDGARRAGRRHQFFSQAGQDAYLDERVFRRKRGGVFVEIGGYDGITGSNCLFFELLRGWTGLLVEPSPTYFRQAAAFRRATCLQLAVADRDGEAEFLEVQEGFTQMSGLTESYDAALRDKVEADPRHRGEVIRVKTRTLPRILDQHFLREIDYISLDVEGGELAVLSAFPFERYRVTAWTVENNIASRAVPDLMRDKGYRRVEALGVDDVYVLDEGGARPWPRGRRVRSGPHRRPAESENR